MGRVAGSHDRRQAKLAADDRGVRRAAAVIGYDRCSTFHDRDPVRIGRLRHQDRSVDETADLARTFDQADVARHDRVADAESRDQLPALRLDAIGFEGACLLAGLHGFGSRLDDEDLAGLAIFGPLHVHGAPIVGLDRAGPAGEREDILIVQHEGGAFCL